MDRYTRKLNQLIETEDDIANPLTRHDLYCRKRKRPKNELTIVREDLKTSYDRMVFSVLMLLLCVSFGLYLYGIIEPQTFIGGTYLSMIVWMVLMACFFLVGRKLFPTFYQSKAFDFAR